MYTPVFLSGRLLALRHWSVGAPPIRRRAAIGGGQWSTLECSPELSRLSRYEGGAGCSSPRGPLEGCLVQARRPEAQHVFAAVFAQPSRLSRRRVLPVGRWSVRRARRGRRRRCCRRLRCWPGALSCCRRGARPSCRPSTRPLSAPRSLGEHSLENIVMILSDMKVMSLVDWWWTDNIELSYLFVFYHSYINSLVLSFLREDPLWLDLQDFDCFVLIKVGELCVRHWIGHYMDLEVGDNTFLEDSFSRQIHFLSTIQTQSPSFTSIIVIFFLL